jgi:hypothetical protein
MNPNDPTTTPQSYSQQGSGIPGPNPLASPVPLPQNSIQPDVNTLGTTPSSYAPYQSPVPPMPPMPPLPTQPNSSVNNNVQSTVSNPIINGQPYLPTSTPPAMPTSDFSYTTPAPNVPAGPSPTIPLPSAPMPSSPVADDAKLANTRLEVIEHLKKANNVLVTVSKNPSVDQLSAAIAITLVLNKLNKHATAVYSGKTPSTLEFLQPEKTIEKNTDSLRDFIISLDKAKADKLRYKVEDQFVKIFITPYHTSINEADLEFSQGDFNVDVVLAIGVHQRDELDQAIVAHGRILHDSVTVSVNNNRPAEIGNLNWFQADASSLSEMLVGLIEPLQGDKALLDNQIATSFLTGVVSETDRFSNNKTTPRTMNVAATLMKAGANQQLVATKLKEPEPLPEEDLDRVKLDNIAKDKSGEASKAPVPTPSKDGSLEIEHKPAEAPNKSTKTLEEIEKENHGKDNSGESDEFSSLAKIHIDDKGGLHAAGEEPKAETSAESTDPTPPKPPSNMILEKPTISGDMSSVTREEPSAPAIPAVDTPAQDTTSSINKAKTIEPIAKDDMLGSASPDTLSDIEAAVNSPHLVKVDEVSESNTEAARAAVETAKTFDNSQRLEPISALNAQPVDIDTGHASDNVTSTEAKPAGDLTTEEVFPPQLVGPDKGPGPDPTASSSESPGAPPPVPPPIIPV